MKSETLTKTIWLVRHGQSTLNRENRFAGKTNCWLTVSGKKTAGKIGRFLRQNPVQLEVIYSSPLARTRQSARIISNWIGINKRNIFIDKRLREQDFGKWEKKTREQVERHWPGLVAKWLSDPYSITPKGGENYFGLESRLMPFVKKILESKARSVLIVAHANSLKVLIKLFLAPKRVNVSRLDVGFGRISKIELNRKQLRAFSIT